MNTYEHQTSVSLFERHVWIHVTNCNFSLSVKECLFFFCNPPCCWSTPVSIENALVLPVIFPLLPPRSHAGHRPDLFLYSILCKCVGCSSRARRGEMINS